MQVVSVEEVEQAVPAEAEGTEQPGLLDRLGDDVLLSFGVPEILLPAVRAVRTSEELLALGKHLPGRGRRGPHLAGRGRSRRGGAGGGRRPPAEERGGHRRTSPRPCEHPDSRRRFVTIQSDDELTAILDAPLEKWRVFLHPSQERLVARSFNGPARVTGGAGTGKTVVAMHRARHLARTRLPVAAGPDPVHHLHGEPRPERRGRASPTSAAPSEDRIEVVHLHAWAVAVPAGPGPEVRGRQPVRTRACWEEAIRRSGEREFDLGFLAQEWEQVVQANGIQTAADYLKVPRIGRGRTLSRPQRQKVWKVVRALRRGPAQAGQDRVGHRDPGRPAPARTEEAVARRTGPSSWTRPRTSTPRSGG